MVIGGARWVVPDNDPPRLTNPEDGWRGENTIASLEHIGGIVIRRSPRPTGNYTIVRNDVARDGRLSYRARGVLLAVLSRPDNWTTTSMTLAKEGKEGRDAIRTALRELENAGYIQRLKARKPDGTWVWEAIVYDVSQSPATGEPTPDNPALDSQASKEDSLLKNCKEETLVASRQRDASADVIQVFTAWQESAGKNERTTLDGKRRRAIEWALKNYPLHDVLDAVVGWKNSAFHRGQNPRNKTYNELTLILRDAEHLEQFRDLARRPAESSEPGAWSTLREMMEEA